MRFGVLGPLEARTGDGEPVTVPDRKVRVVLAALLAHRARVVPADRLVDDLWGSGLAARPSRPAATLQARVSQLRRTLEDAEPGARALVESRPPGYLLAVTADDVDSGTFEALAERAAAVADPRSKAALLDEALALWRGEAFAGFDEVESVRAEAVRLEELRLTVVEERAEALLELGERHRLAGELAEHVARHPLRERLRAAHMRALYRAGRQHEALRAYDELREHLREELGLDPAPGLAALHQAILRQDPALDARPRTNLPAPVTGLVGREGALRDVRAELARTRLLTLTGPGGVGKTRLALEAARETVPDHPDGVWLVELAALDHVGAALVPMVSAALGVRDGDRPAADPVERLAGALRGRRMLLILDNCEHVVEPVAALVAVLLRSVPGLRVLATSRQPLGVYGERLWPVPPLEVPRGGEDLAELARYGAVELFTARAGPGFALAAANAAAVAAICRRLDGLPLALELAATRVRALGARELAARLDDRFRLLDGGARDAPGRQRTLRAVIDWSHEPLPEPDRRVLRRLAVHADGCTLEAAERVCDDGDVLDRLAGLVDRSLVVMAETPGGPRYRLLESVAAYCVERLREAGEYERTRRRHYLYHLGLAERAEPRLRSHDQREWLARLDAESADMRAALDAAVEDGAAEAALRLVNALCWSWFLRGRLGEALHALDKAIGAATGAASRGIDPALLARARTWRAGLAMLEGDGNGRAELTREALAAFEGLGDGHGRAWAAWFLGFARAGFGDLGAIDDLVGQALDGFAAAGDGWGTAAALRSRAGQAMVRGDLAAVERDGERSAALFRSLGDRWGLLQVTEPLGVLAETRGDYPRAAAYHEDGLRTAEELGLWTEASGKLARLGRVALLEGDHDRADDLHRRAARLARAESHRRAENFAEIGLALAARRRGDLDAAESYLRAWLDWCRDADGSPGLALILAELGFVAELRGDGESALRLHREGLAAARATGNPRAVALALEGLAGALDDPGEAARSLEEATAIRASTGAPLPPAERADVDRIAARIAASATPTPASAG
ncbi:AfsR/SARP family transcriptional regulator [Actinomadura rugatobispora]|uniref:BTAD domain-containing putative transcriptional regulator n=1 Tax=Actinomadura rugatobispora TaxID=1994 RepID=A0ABW0ZXA2_9ACTN|nr:BTAD domain-containing putative transcriptional regulator [Actinomadura rugatobispora]